MARTRKSAYREFSRLHGRTERIRKLNRVAIVALVGAISSAALVCALPQWRKLREMEEELVRRKDRETLVLEQRDVLLVEQRALREDTAFLELKARDRLDYYRDGERIYRIQRDQ